MKKYSQFLLLLSLIAMLLPGPLAAQPSVWPNWTATTAGGESFDSHQLDGKVVLISVWGSWSQPCRKQIPILDSLQSTYGQSGMQVLAFSLDRSSECHEQYIRENRIKIPSIFARSGEGLKVVRMLQEGAGTLEAVPTVLIYDRKGRLAHRMVGFFNRQELEALLLPLLKQ